MGWKGTVRSINSTMRAMDRDAQRRKRERERRDKERVKLQALELAAFEVEEYEEEIRSLTSMHVSDDIMKIDWQKIANSKSPEEPKYVPIKSITMKEKHDNYIPSALDKMMKKVEKKKNKLAERLRQAELEDRQEYQESIRKYKQELSDWEESRENAKKILSCDTDAFIEAMKELNPFAHLAGLTQTIQFNLDSKECASASCSVDLGMLPKEKKSLLKSGKLSVKQLSTNQFNDLAQDFICSLALRLSQDLFGILPIEWSIINISTDLLDTSTGRLNEELILSVAIPRDTLSKLNIATLDPSDSMKNFKHEMSFKKTTGFLPVKRVNIDN